MYLFETYLSRFNLPINKHTQQLCSAVCQAIKLPGQGCLQSSPDENHSVLQNWIDKKLNLILNN